MEDFERLVKNLKESYEYGSRPRLTSTDGALMWLLLVSLAGTELKLTTKATELDKEARVLEVKKEEHRVQISVDQLYELLKPKVTISKFKKSLKDGKTIKEAITK